MLKVISAFIFLTASSFIANAGSCLGEAQFSAQVSQVAKVGNQCRVFITNITHYSENSFCPLSQSEVKSQGIDITSRMKNNNCAYDYSEISGIAVMQENGNIILD